MSGVARKTGGTPSKRDHYRILVVSQPNDDPQLSLLNETIVIIYCNLADTVELRAFFETIGHSQLKTIDRVHAIPPKEAQRLLNKLNPDVRPE